MYPNVKRQNTSRKISIILEHCRDMKKEIKLGNTRDAKRKEVFF